MEQVSSSMVHVTVRYTPCSYVTVRYTTRSYLTPAGALEQHRRHMAPAGTKFKERPQAVDRMPMTNSCS